MSPLETVLVTGLSGSGKSTVLHTLEDIGYFCIDNLPAPLILKLLALPHVKKYKKLALTMDAREREFIKNPKRIVSGLKRVSRQVDIIFVESDTRSIKRRYSVTRRRHPLSQKGSIESAIRREREYLKKIRDYARIVIDTSDFTPRDLSETIRNYFISASRKHPLEISIVSFSFQRGIPEEADIVFDVRFLPNPHFVPRLSRLNGKNKSVRSYVFSYAESRVFLSKTLGWLLFLIPKYKKEGKSYLTIAVGCTGGKHRSVAISEELFRKLRARGHSCHLLHREVLN